MMIKVNEKYFSKIYDASKYVLLLAAENKPVEISRVHASEAFHARLHQK